MNRNRFQFPIPFDPFRLLLAGMEKAWLWIIAGLLCAAAGVAAALILLGDSYKAPIKLAKEGAPLYWNPDLKAPYRPRPLSGEALELIARSPAVYERTGLMAGGQSLEMIRTLVTFSNSAGEDLYEITAHSKESDQAALDLAKAYAKAIIAIAGEKRHDEANQAATVLRTQLEHRQEALAAAGDALKARSSDQSGLLNGERIDEHFGEVQNLRSRATETRIALLAKKENLDVNLRQSILNPIQQELAELRSQRTDQHPSVRRKMQEMKMLEAKLGDVASGKGSLENLSSTVPAPLLRQALDLRDEIKMLESSLGEYERMLSQAGMETASMSEQALRTADIRSSFDREVENSATIESRLKDAEFFASNESGSPVSLFGSPHVADVDVKSRWFKAAVLGIGGLIAGSGLALALIFFREMFNKTVRTPMQAAISSSTLPRFTFPGGSRTKANLHDFAVTCILKFLPDRRFLFPIVGKVDGEGEFWQQLLEAFTRGDGGQRVVFADVSHQPIDLKPNGAALTEYKPNDPNQFVSCIDIRKHTGENFANFAKALPLDTVLLVRWDTDPDATLAALAPHIEHHYLIASPVSSKVAELEELSRVYEQVLGEPEGLVLVQEKRSGFSSRLISSIERWFIQFQSQRSNDAAASFTPSRSDIA